MNIADLKEILDAPEIVFFLPAINSVYLFATTNLPYESILILGSIVSSAVVYALLSGIPANKSREVRLEVSILLGLASIVWISALLYSMWGLYDSFRLRSVLHEVLFFSTLALVVVGIVNLLLIRYVDEYNSVF